MSSLWLVALLSHTLPFIVYNGESRVPNLPSWFHRHVFHITLFSSASIYNYPSVFVVLLPKREKLYVFPDWCSLFVTLNTKLHASYSICKFLVKSIKHIKEYYYNKLGARSQSTKQICSWETNSPSAVQLTPRLSGGQISTYSVRFHTLCVTDTSQHGWVTYLIVNTSN
jgi:hypothetical protein